MGIYDFNIMSLNDKATLVWDKGTFLHNRKVKDFKVNLHAFSYFYVEIWVTDEPIRIEQIKLFKTNEFLKLYFDSFENNQF